MENEGGGGMIKIIEKRICDVCKKEVEDFNGSLFLRYSDSDYKGCGYPVKIECKDVCIKCCRELNNVIETATKKLEGAT